MLDEDAVGMEPARLESAFLEAVRGQEAGHLGVVEP
jgi:hypothetical protein